MTGKKKDTSAAMPSEWYGDPARAIDNEKLWKQLDFYQKRAKTGCNGCKWQQEYWNHKLCSRGRRPKPYYCHDWRDRDEMQE